jgi:hypothetical protein
VIFGLDGREEKRREEKREGEKELKWASGDTDKNKYHFIVPDQTWHILYYLWASFHPPPLPNPSFQWFPQK